MRCGLPREGSGATLAEARILQPPEIAMQGTANTRQLTSSLEFVIFQFSKTIA